MTLISRRYTKHDYQAVCNLLIESYRTNQNLHNWSIRHWEGQVYHRADLDSFPERPIWVWQDKGKVVGVAHAEYEGNVFFQVLPDYRQIEPKMLIWAEQHLASHIDNCSSLETWAFEGDESREEMLAAAGFEQGHFFMNNRRREGIQEIPSAPLAEGYQIRGMHCDYSDCIQMAALLNAAFNRDFHQPEEYANFQTAPHYRPEFDLVAIAPDGSLAANAQVTLVHENTYAEFEPVCTHPEHQRKGLARMLMAEGLRMLEARGIQTVYVDAAGDNPASNALYEQMGFSEVQRLFVWKKIWEKSRED